MKDEFYAHSKEGFHPEHWHRLEDHLKNVAEMAQKFAAEFNAGDWGYLAGLCRDLGKHAVRSQMAFTLSVRLTKRTTAKVEMDR